MVGHYLGIPDRRTKGLYESRVCRISFVFSRVFHIRFPKSLKNLQRPANDGNANTAAFSRGGYFCGNHPYLAADVARIAALATADRPVWQLAQLGLQKETGVMIFVAMSALFGYRAVFLYSTVIFLRATDLADQTESNTDHDQVSRPDTERRKCARF